MSETEALRREVDEISLAMLQTGQIEPLRPALQAARAALAEAEAAAAAQERRPTREELWQQYRELRILGRRRMSARTKSRVLRTYGKRLYEALPW